MALGPLASSPRQASWAHSPRCIIFAVSLQGPHFFWSPGLMPGQLFRCPSPSTVLLKRFPWWSREHTVPAKGRDPRVPATTLWRVLGKRTCRARAPVSPSLRGGQGGMQVPLCPALHPSAMNLASARHLPEAPTPAQGLEELSLEFLPLEGSSFHAVTSVPSAPSPMLRQAHAAGCLPSAPHGPGWCPTQWALAWPVDVCADKPACPSVLPALSPGPPPSWNWRSVPSGRARRALLSPRKPLSPERSRLAHAE